MGTGEGSEMTLYGCWLGYLFGCNCIFVIEIHELASESRNQRSEIGLVAFVMESLDDNVRLGNRGRLAGIAWVGITWAGIFIDTLRGTDCIGTLGSPL